MIILDRFEEEYAVLEIDGETASVPREMVAEHACEGDVLCENNGRYIVDTAATTERRAVIRERLRRLINRND